MNSEFCLWILMLRRDTFALSRVSFAANLLRSYGRIFSRINEKLPNPHAREKARRILGWVGCSPMPLTIQELQQALSIRVGDSSQIPQGYSTLNLVLLCGPVVELVDDEVHFVHFTAKQ